MNDYCYRLLISVIQNITVATVLVLQLRESVELMKSKMTDFKVSYNSDYISIVYSLRLICIYFPGD